MRYSPVDAEGPDKYGQSPINEPVEALINQTLFEARALLSQLATMKHRPDSAFTIVRAMVDEMHMVIHTLLVLFEKTREEHQEAIDKLKAVQLELDQLKGDA